LHQIHILLKGNIALIKMYKKSIRFLNFKFKINSDVGFLKTKLTLLNQNKNF